MEHYLGYGEPDDVDEQLFIEKYNILERRKSELGELGMIGDASMFKNPYEPQDRIPKMIGALVTPYTEHRTLPHMMDMTPGLGALLGALTTPYTEHRSLPHLIDMTPGLGGAEGKNPYEPQDTIPRMIGSLGATYKCKICGWKTNDRKKMAKHLARETFKPPV